MPWCRFHARILRLLRRWRYVEWFKYNDTALKADFGATVAVELYDHGADAGDDMDFLVTNVVGDPANAATVAAMAKVVREGWKQQRPSSSSVE